jgi:hypothetical protein
MRFFLIILAISGCASSAPDFFGATRHEVTKGGMDFVVFHKGSEVEVVRLGYLTRSQRSPVPRLMEAAVAEVTGCKVIANSMRTKIPGDTGVARFDLDCR